MLSLNTRLAVGTVSGLISIGLGYYIFKNYRYYLSCPHHKCEHSQGDNGDKCQGGTCGKD